MMAAPPALLAFYGGTFDPVHNGHLAIARCARDTLDTEIRLMPAADPPHRAPPGASAAQRAAMLELAIIGERELLVDRRELARSTPSWTIDTLRQVRGEVGDQQPIALLLGADSLHGLTSWKAWRELFDLAHFVVAPRAGNPLDNAFPAELEAYVSRRRVDSPLPLRNTPAGLIVALQQPLQAESATDVRQRIATGAPWRDLLPAAVADYIEHHHLYADMGPLPASL